MKTIVALFILGFVMFELINAQTNQPTDYSDTSSFPYHSINTCKSTGNFFDIEVKVEYPSDTGDFVGKWVPREDKILLKLGGGGTDIDTIAHEVHHMVDTMMERYNVEDDHYGAYLQGSFTRCVWEIVREDLRVLNQ